MCTRVVEEILCIVYEKVFDTSSGIDIHLTNKQSTDIKDKVHDNASEPVRLESLLSCNQCDFDTDNNDSLLTHYKKNMHDVLNLNKTLEEKNTTQEVEVETERIKENRNNTELSCHLCEYSTKVLREMEDHKFRKHGIINCDKCEYSAEDSDIMKKHKMKHTGRILFTCNICEFETSKQSMLVEHKEAKHKSTEEINKEKTVFECNRCETDFQYGFLLKNHTCIPTFKYPCEICTFVAISVGEILEHMNAIHSKNSTPCSFCEFIAKFSENYIMPVADLQKSVKCGHFLPKERIIISWSKQWEL